MPFVSKAQERYFNAHRKQMEAQGVNVDEWNKSSKGKPLPERKGPTAKDKAMARLKRGMSGKKR